MARISQQISVAAGHRAALAFACAEAGRVAGVTSRGVFVRRDCGEIIFMTREPYRSPLTINLPAGSDGLRRVVTGMAVRLGHGGLEIPEAAVAFSLQRAEPWRAPGRRAPARPAAERYAAARDLSRAVLLGQPDSNLTAWLRALASMSAVPPELRIMRRALRAHEVQALVGFVTDQLLGHGRGLTPAGDDCIVGLLLTLNRWRSALWPGPHLEQLNAGITSAAQRRTTAISASLIDCAAKGEADERLIAAVDGLMTGEPALSECAAGLQLYGATSGIDTLAGMVVALLAGEA